MTGLYEYWEYPFAGTTNVAVTNWVGKIQGIILTNGAAARQPTNSANGVGFGGGTFGLTNLPILLSTNWGMVFFAKCTDNGTVINAGGGIAGLFGTYGNGSLATKYEFFLGFGGASKAQYQGYNNVNFYSSTVYPIPQSTFSDVILCNSNTAAASAFYCWTNGVLLSAGSGSLQNQTNNFIGYDGYGTANGDAGYVGFIQGIYVITNAITGIMVSNIHYYRTNISQFPQ